MCNVLHTVAFLNQCNVMSLSWDLGGGARDWLLYCVLWLFGAFGQILTASWASTSQALWPIKPCAEYTFVFTEPWTVQDNEKGVCKDLWWFCKPSIPWSFQPFWRINEVYYPTLWVGSFWSTELHTWVTYVSVEQKAVTFYVKSIIIHRSPLSCQGFCTIGCQAQDKKLWKTDWLLLWIPMEELWESTHLLSGRN